MGFATLQIETIVNPIKSGMRTIKNMPDTLVGGIAKILLGRGPMKQSSFLDVMPAIEVKESVPSVCVVFKTHSTVSELLAMTYSIRPAQKCLLSRVVFRYGRYAKTKRARASNATLGTLISDEPGGAERRLLINYNMAG